MKIQDVIASLAKLNTFVSHRTLLNYEKWNLIPLANRTSLGRGLGKSTEYPDEVVAEAYAASQLLNGIIKTSPQIIANVREIILKVEEDPSTSVPYEMELRFLCELWASYRYKALTGIECPIKFLEIDDRNYIAPIDKI